MTEDSEVVVPNLIGKRVDDARTIGAELRLVIVSPILDGASLGAHTWPGFWYVTSQSPAAGTKLGRGELVTITFTKMDGHPPDDPVPAIPVSPDPSAFQAGASPEPDPAWLDFTDPES